MQAVNSRNEIAAMKSKNRGLFDLTYNSFFIPDSRPLSLCSFFFSLRPASLPLASRPCSCRGSAMGCAPKCCILLLFQRMSCVICLISSSCSPPFLLSRHYTHLQTTCRPTPPKTRPSHHYTSPRFAQVSMSMYVVKRNGRGHEPVLFDKITARISKLCYGLNNEYVDSIRISQKVWLPPLPPPLSTTTPLSLPFATAPLWDPSPSADWRPCFFRIRSVPFARTFFTTSLSPSLLSLRNPHINLLIPSSLDS
jgi:hypothetical protein